MTPGLVLRCCRRSILSLCKEVRCIDSLLVFVCPDPEAARVASSKITTTLGLVVHAAGANPTLTLVCPAVTEAAAHNNNSICADETPAVVVITPRTQR